MNFNAYFAGGGIGMAQVRLQTSPFDHWVILFQPIYNETVDYAEMGDKETKPYQSQISKDITTFLRWACEPSRESLQLRFWRSMFLLIPSFGLLYMWNKRTWSGLKNTNYVKAEDLRKFK